MLGTRHVRRDLIELGGEYRRVLVFHAVAEAGGHGRISLAERDLNRQAPDRFPYLELQRRCRKAKLEAAEVVNGFDRLLDRENVSRRTAPVGEYLHAGFILDHLCILAAGLAVESCLPLRLILEEEGKRKQLKLFAERGAEGRVADADIQSPLLDLLEHVAFAAERCVRVVHQLEAAA